MLLVKRDQMLVICLAISIDELDKTTCLHVYFYLTNRYYACGFGFHCIYILFLASCYGHDFFSGNYGHEN